MEIKTLRQVQDEYILLVLYMFKGMRKPTAGALQMSIRNLHSQLSRIKKAYGIDPNVFVASEWRKEREAAKLRRKMDPSKTRDDLFWEVKGMPTNEERIAYLNDMSNRSFL